MGNSLVTANISVSDRLHFCRYQVPIYLPPSITQKNLSRSRIKRKKQARAVQWLVRSHLLLRNSVRWTWHLACAFVKKWMLIALLSSNQSNSIDLENRRWIRLRHNYVLLAALGMDDMTAILISSGTSTTY